jgi:thioredoxin:protein disulfide reductase
VLGMASMYSVLGLVAAFTGGLFGGFLQNPLVLVGIGVLLGAMALSMFGFYEIQMPAALRERAGTVSATSVAGVFLSGLVVGVFAAPCIGPPVVALLAIVGAKADPWFGFTSFFTLALGLGVPYLVLGTFSNLLQTLPRSGDWMEWVKKLFGVILLGIAAFYILLGLKPDLASWVLPVVLVAGGAYLGFIDQHADRRKLFKVFKRVGGAVAVVGGLAIVATTPRHGLTMPAFSQSALDEARRSGKIVMVDFSADWCVPCHELERYTFTDRRVMDSARRFATFKADLTRYDSPESEAWRKQYNITGVPTVLFLAPDGSEVRASRVEGFLPADMFLQRMETAVSAGQQGEIEIRP